MMAAAADSPKTATLTSTASRPDVPRVRQLLPWALASSLLLYLCFFPVAWGWLAWVALVPLLVLVRSEANKKTVFLAAWIAGLAFFFPAVQWLRVADPRMYFTWFLMAFYCSFYFPVGVLLVRALDRGRLPLVLSLPVVWTALEFLRAHLMEGFPWYYLAHSQHDFLPLIQIADITGAYGVSFLVAAVNALAFEWLQRAPAYTVRRPVLAFQSALVLLVFAGFLLYGSWRMNQADFAKGPAVALMQGNVPQQIRNSAGSANAQAREDAISRIQAGYNRLSRLAAEKQPDLIVYPETSFMEDWNEIITTTPERLNSIGLEMIEDAKKLAAQVSLAHASGTHRPYVLLGLNATDWYPEQEPPRLHYNSALLIGPDGMARGRYDKIHRVPFGEYVPLRDWLPFMDSFAPYDYDYSIAPGREQTRLPLLNTHFGVLICYEDTDTVLSRRYVDPASEKKPDFLINISNDGWFDGTSEHEQHLATCRFRAIEARRSIVRSVNMGISAVIDGNGRVLAPELSEQRGKEAIWEVSENAGDFPVRRWSEFKKVAGVLFAKVPLDSRGSLYARWGDWLPWTCCVLLALGLVIARLRRGVPHQRESPGASGG